MIAGIGRRSTPIPIVGALILLGSPLAARAQSGDAAQPSRQSQQPQQIAARSFVFSNAANNLLVQTEPHATLVVGVQDPALVAEARAWLAARHAAAVRFVLAAAGDSAAYDGDGGWGASGATVLAHEALRGHMMGVRHANAIPALGFSEVVQMSLGDDEAHAVHQKTAGYGASDVTMHLESADVLYLGNIFTTDGYPDIDIASGGSIKGLITTVSWFVTNFGDNAKIHYVPGRGAAASAAALRDYRDMLVSVRDRVQPMVTAGKSDGEIVAAHPASAFDAKWGHERLSSDRFVTLVAQSLRRH